MNAIWSDILTEVETNKEESTTVITGQIAGFGELLCSFDPTVNRLIVNLTITEKPETWEEVEHTFDAYQMTVMRTEQALLAVKDETYPSEAEAMAFLQGFAENFRINAWTKKTECNTPLPEEKPASTAEKEADTPADTPADANEDLSSLLDQLNKEIEKTDALPAEDKFSAIFLPPEEQMKRACDEIISLLCTLTDARTELDRQRKAASDDFSKKAAQLKEQADALDVAKAELDQQREAFKKEQEKQNKQAGVPPEVGALLKKSAAAVEKRMQQERIYIEEIKTLQDQVQTAQNQIQVLQDQIQTLQSQEKEKDAEIERLKETPALPKQHPEEPATAEPAKADDPWKLAGQIKKDFSAIGIELTTVPSDDEAVLHGQKGDCSLTIHVTARVIHITKVAKRKSQAAVEALDEQDIRKSIHISGGHQIVCRIFFADASEAAPLADAALKEMEDL